MKLFVSALEPSSNMHLKFLIKELQKHTSIDLYGVFANDISDDMPLYSPNDFSIMGFSDVIKKTTFLLKALSTMQNLALKCDKILLLDSSSFHIPLAKRIKKANPNKEIIYYILPQVWAWKPWRVKTIEKYNDILAAILPFEVALYKMKARYVGHPLLDEIAYFKENNPNKHTKILTFMPGSRLGEINRIFPTFIALKDKLKAQDSSLRFRLVVPQRFDKSDLGEIYKDLSDFEIVFDAHKSLYESDFAFICSGTATLECAIIGTPFVLCYKAKWLDAFIVKKFLNIKYVGLANILYQHISQNELFHDEILQEDFNVARLLLSYTQNKNKDFISKSIKLRQYLGYGSVKQMCKLLLENTKIKEL